MRKVFVLILFCLQSCNYFQSCNETISGKYFAKNDETTTIYLDLKENGTFYHYFKYETDEFSHTGKWKISKDGYCKVFFDDWENYNKKGVHFNKHIDGMTLFVNKKSLDYTPDGSNSLSYKKR